MIWLVRDFDLLSLLLRAVSFALEALAFGGVVFLFVCARPSGLAPEVHQRLRRIASRFALGLALTQIALIATTSAMLMGNGSGMGLRDVVSAAYFLSGATFVAAALTLSLLLRLASGLAFATMAGFVALGA